MPKNYLRRRPVSNAGRDFPSHEPIMVDGVRYTIVENKFGFHARMGDRRCTGNLRTKELVKAQLERQ